MTPETKGTDVLAVLRTTAGEVEAFGPVLEAFCKACDESTDGGHMTSILRLLVLPMVVHADMAHLEAAGAPLTALMHEYRVLLDKLFTQGLAGLMRGLPKPILDDIVKHTIAGRSRFIQPEEAPTEKPPSDEEVLH